MHAFFGLTFLLTTPFWLLGAITGAQLMPGLPIAALAVACPAAAALALAFRSGGAAGAAALLRRALPNPIPRWPWWTAILLISPVVSVAAFLVLRLSGAPVPDPVIALPSALGLFALFLAAAISEELGWSGYALGPLQARLGVTAAALLVGGVWSLWHYPALFQAGRSMAWIAWWTLGTLALRAIMVWIYNGTGGSVFGVAVFHAMSNLCWQLFPEQGSWFDPRLNGGLLAVVAAAAMWHGRRAGRRGARPPAA